VDTWFRNEVQPHETELRCTLQHLVPTDDIDDLVQESYARLLGVLARRPVFYARALLLTIGRNAARDLHRHRFASKTASVGTFDDLNVYDGGQSTPEIVSLRQENTLLQDAIRKLPERCRRILIMRRLEGLSRVQIAERLGISPKTVDVQVTRAIERCSQFLVARGALPAAWPKGDK
jgi:RNA polymerase sigma factor (sigma-70 family)